MVALRRARVLAWCLASAFPLSPAAAATPSELRTLTLSVIDEKGAPVTGLETSELALLENGLVREITRLEPDRRRVTLALVVDSSEALADSLRLHVVSALASFVDRLPRETRLCLWTTGDRPTLVQECTDDRGRLLQALKRITPRGGNTLLDTLVESSRALGKREAERAVVLAVTGVGVEFSNIDRRQVVDQGVATGVTFTAVQIEAGEATRENRQDYEYTLDGLARLTGGQHEVVLSAMGVGTALSRIASELQGQYRLSYASIPDIKNRKLEVKLARPGVKVRIGSQTP